MKRHTLLIGPPGSGKTKWAREQAESRRPIANSDSEYAYRVAGLIVQGPTWTQAFRAPHHTASIVAMVGRLDGHRWRPGEFSLAHGGILFLDELPEFSTLALEALREPLGIGKIDLGNSVNRLVVPADFTLIAASNPCPCGGPPFRAKRRCSCTAAQIDRYLARIPKWLREKCRVLGPVKYALRAG